LYFDVYYILFFVCFFLYHLVINKVAQKCFQLATKSNGRPQQLQFCRLPSGAATEKALWPIRRRVGGTMRSLDDEARSADRVGTSATDVSM